VVTCIGPAHVEFFGTTEAIAREKAVLLSALARDGTAVLNRDTDFFDVLRAAAGCRVLTVSMKQDADYTCVERRPGSRQAVIRERCTGDRCCLDLGIPADYQAMNIMLAVAVARGFGVSWDRIREAASRYVPLPMRWEERCARGLRVINDAYNANPLSMRAAVRALREEPSEGDKWLVLGGMLEMGPCERSAHAELGAFVAASEAGAHDPGVWLAGLITVGELGEIIAEGALRAGMTPDRVFRCGSNEAAVRRLARSARQGDTVLLKASRGIRLEEISRLLEQQDQGVDDERN
jgi:UDP-N-acetylmuramoyl-tripeptide--D-alanyl-D-alanine ligase